MPKLEELLKDADFKKEYDAAVQTAIDAEVKGLKDKNKELLGKKKDAETERDELQAKLDEAIAEGGKGQADIEKVTKQLTDKHTRELKKAQDAAEASSSKLNKILIDKGLGEALTKAGVAPQYLDAVKALIKTSHKAEVGEVDGDAVASIDGKPVAEFVKSWSQGDQGKHYIAAPTNNGGGATGSDGKAKGGTGKTMKRSDFDALPPSDKAKTAKEGITLTD